MHAHLINMATGERIELSKQRVLIGRRRDCDIVVNHYTVSAHHCLLFRTEDEGCWYVRDLKSTNGTWVNGMQVDEMPISSGDDVSLGKSLRFLIEYGL